MDKPPSTFKTLWRLYVLGWRFPGAFLVMLVGMVAMGGLNAGLVYFMKPVLEVLAPGMAGPEVMQSLSDGQVAELRADMIFLAWVSAYAIIPAAVTAGGTWWISQWLANRSMQELRERFFGHYLRLEMGFHTGASKGDMITRMSADAEATTGVIQSLYGKFQQRPVEAIGMLVTLAFINLYLFLSLFGVLVPMMMILIRLFGKTKRRADKAREVNATTLSSFEQAASGIRVIKSLGCEEAEDSRYHLQTEDLRRSEMKTVKSRSWADAFSYSLTFLLPLVIMVVGVWMLDTDAINPLELVVFAAALGRMSNLTRTIQRSWTDILTKVAAVDRFFEVLDRPIQIIDKPDAKVVDQPRQSIELREVRFRYQPDSEEVLKGISLTIPVGKTVALVGESGGGKSTILDLLPRFYDVTGGSICLDGEDVRDLKHSSLVHQFAVVQQESFLFNDTVLANIAYGSPHATQEQVEQAARRAHVHEAILKLEGGQGYQTVVGDRGERLSGGQRQRVAIARALLRDAPILLLDEPTSALDADSEQHVQEALDELMQDRTCVVVAHRLATIQHADLICVLDAGQIIEQGSHDELVARDGAYARLVRLQQLRG